MAPSIDTDELIRQWENVVRTKALKYAPNPTAVAINNLRQAAQRLRNRVSKIVND